MMLGRGYEGFYGHGMMDRGFLFGGICMAVIAVIIIVGIILLVHFMRKSHGVKGSRNEALEILQTRLAKGEITEEEFKAKKKILKL